MDMIFGEEDNQGNLELDANEFNLCETELANGGHVQTNFLFSPRL